jgi:hypothetical protein
MDAAEFVWIMFVKRVGGLRRLWAIIATEMEERIHVISVQVLSDLPWEECNKVSETSDQTCHATFLTTHTTCRLNNAQRGSQKTYVLNRCNFDYIVGIIRHNCTYLFFIRLLTLILLTWKIGWATNNASKWQMGVNPEFKAIIIMLSKNICSVHSCKYIYHVSVAKSS